ncbi:MAG: hypothetical protein AAB393_13765 [Bacteroidota bacterium]
MRLLLEILADTVFFTPSLIVSEQPLTRKVRVLVAYVRLTMNLLFLNSIIRLRRARFLGFHIHCFDYRIVHLLFRTMFLRNEYFFRSDSPHPVILDCGANIGMATLFFKWLYPDCEVHARMWKRTASPTLRCTTSHSRPDQAAWISSLTLGGPVRCG